MTKEDMMESIETYISTLDYKELESFVGKLNRVIEGIRE